MFDHVGMLQNNYECHKPFLFIMLLTEYHKNHLNQITKLKWFFFLKKIPTADENEIIVGASTTQPNRPLHGNNYELTEFDARGPTYRYDCKMFFY